MSQVAKCANPECGKELEPKRRGGGPDKRHCNNKCRYRAWDLENPRQRKKK